MICHHAVKVKYVLFILLELKKKQQQQRNVDRNETVTISSFLRF